MDIHYGKPTQNTFGDILDQYSTDGLNSARTSSIPFLNYWKEADARIQGFLRGVGIFSAARIGAFEFPTRSLGSNKASMTDLMIFCDDWKIGIEAKFTKIQRRSESSEQWNANRTENRSRVLSHWLSRIQPFVREPLKEVSVATVPYQFVHRVASCCDQNAGNACTVYQIFCDEATRPMLQGYIEELRDSARKLLAGPRLKIWIQTVMTRQLEIEVELSAVLQTLKEIDLYTFGEENFIQLVP